VADDPSSTLYCTPPRNSLQLDVWILESKLARHPWARFVKWFTEQTAYFEGLTEEEESEFYDALYSYEQTISMEEYTIVFRFVKRSFDDSNDGDGDAAPSVRFLSHTPELIPQPSEFRIYGNLNSDTDLYSDDGLMSPAQIADEFERLKRTVVEHEQYRLAQARSKAGSSSP
jgi:hypothetical protein